MVSRQPSIAVVVVGFESKEYLEDCFNSLAHSSIQPNWKIFVDNNSTDGSTTYIGTHFPDVVVVPQSRNLGFAGANNIGIDLAIQNGADYIFLLNPDAYIHENCIEQLLSRANGNTVLQPLILVSDSSKTEPLVNTAGNDLTFTGFSYCGSYKESPDSYREYKSICLASGAAALFPAQILTELGGFDTAYFLYHEDVDLSWRSRMLGYDIALVPSAHVWHKYSFSRNPKKMFYAERNRMYFMLKNFGTRTLLLTLPFHLINELVMLMYALISGWLLEKIKSYGAFIYLIPQALRNRKIIQSQRVKSDRDLAHLFTSKLQFGGLDIPLLSVYNSISSWYWSLIKRAL